MIARTEENDSSELKDGRESHSQHHDELLTYSKSEDENKAAEYNFNKKLFLAGIHFLDFLGQNLIFGLQSWKELTIKNWKFDVLSESNPFVNMNWLQSLSIINSDSLFDVLHKADNLFKSLQVLKLNSVKNTKLMNIIQKFIYLKSLRIANFNFEEFKIEFDPWTLPQFLKRFEMIRCNVTTDTILNICVNNFWNVHDLVLLDNTFQKASLDIQKLDYSHSTKSIKNYKYNKLKKK